MWVQTEHAGDDEKQQIKFYWPKCQVNAEDAYTCI